MSIWDQPFEGVDPITYRKFLDYAAKHPKIWTAFQAIANQLIKRGFKHCSADAICHRIRWRELLATKGKYKINNNWASYYGRAFERKYPQHAGFFEQRVTKGVRSKEAA